MKIKTKNILKIILFTFIFTIISFSIINAAEIAENTNYTKEYKRWLELPEEERKNYIEPAKYPTNYIPNNSKNREMLLKTKFVEKFSVLEYADVLAKNQQDTGSCWAFSTTTVLETNIQKQLKRKMEFSPRHMEYSTSKTFLDGINEHGFNREVGDGGNHKIALNYITAGYGPVFEKDMPFENNEDKINLSEIENKDVPIMINQYIDLPTIYKEYNNDGTVSKYTNGYEEGNEERIEYTESEIEEIRDQIKNHILNYGAISTHTYMKSNKYLNKSDSMYEYYCNNENEISNHAVTIVGWDDTYKKENFSSEYGQPAHDGAYLVLNSWGTSWSTLGYFYVSYDDALVEENLIGIIDIKDKDYDNIYQHDILGSNRIVGYSAKNFAYFANVFDRKDINKIEKLTEISFEILDETNIQIYVNLNGKELNINNLTYIGEMNNLKAGYYTYKLESPMLIENESFAIVLKCTNPISNGIYFLGEGTANEGFWTTAVVGQGESYISSNGTTWSDVYSNNINFSVKGFTKEYNNIRSSTIENYQEQYVYTGSEIKPDINIKMNDIYLVENTDYTITYQNNINVGTATIVINGMGNYSGTTTVEFQIIPKNINSLSTVSIDTSSKKYTGNAITTAILLKDIDKNLDYNVDYTVNYEKNLNVGTATVTVSGIGNYTGNIVDTFSITAVNLSELDLVINKDEKEYTGNEIETSISIKYGNITLIKDTDYTVSYENNINVGTVTLTITCIGNYTGDIEDTFAIIPKNISKVITTINTDNKIYTGNEITTDITLNDENKTLNILTDYIVNYSNNIDIGNATVIITGVGNYTGTIYRYFRIINYNIQDTSVSVNTYDKEYIGTEIKPEVAIRGVNSLLLSEGIHYKVTYRNNINVGIATIVIEGIGEYDGIVQKTFRIIPKHIYNASIYLDKYDYIYSEKENRPTVSIIYNNKNLLYGKDFIVEYKNNIDVGMGTAIVKGIGNYDSESNLFFWIYKAENTISTSVKNTNVKYKNVKKKKQVISPIIVSNAKGNVTYSKTSGNKNFTVNKNTGKITVKKNTKKGTYKIKIKVKALGNSNYYEKVKTLTIKIKIK